MFNKFRFSLIALAALALVLVVPHVLAQETTPATVEFTGTISAISDDGLTLTVDGLVVDVSAAETDLTFEVGMIVKVEGTVLDDGTIAASEVSAPDVPDVPDDSVDNTPDDTLELVGTLDSLDDQTAVIGGMTFDVTGAEIGEGVAVGETVKVHASLSEDGTTWLASEIELFQDEDTVGEDTSDDSQGEDVNDDSSDDNITGACLFTVDEDSANLRSGPGTGYDALGYALEDEQFSVLETHTSGDWVKVSSAVGEAWIATSTGELSGDCSALPVSSEVTVGTGNGSDDSSDDVNDDSQDVNDDDRQGENEQEDANQQQETEHEDDSSSTSTSESSG